MSTTQISARDWLVENNYPEVAAKIDRVCSLWAKNGKLTRWNWWDVLAGGFGGKPKKIEGTVFPVMRAARLRKG
jgi:hypothetical protein